MAEWRRERAPPFRSSPPRCSSPRRRRRPRPTGSSTTGEIPRTSAAAAAPTRVPWFRRAPSPRSSASRSSIRATRRRPASTTRPTGRRRPARSASEPGRPQVATAAYSCTYTDLSTFPLQQVDVVTATIPAQPGGTLVRYVMEAWNTSGTIIPIFANSGTCATCIACRPRPARRSSSTSIPAPDEHADVHADPHSRPRPQTPTAHADAHRVADDDPHADAHRDPTRTVPSHRARRRPDAVANADVRDRRRSLPRRRGRRARRRCRRRRSSSIRPPRGTSNGNGVFEPGETVGGRARLEERLRPRTVALDGAASDFTGRSGRLYGIPDADAGYGDILAGRHGKLHGDRQLLSHVDPRRRRSRVPSRTGTRPSPRRPSHGRHAEGLDAARRRELLGRADVAALLPEDRDDLAQRDHVRLHDDHVLPLGRGAALPDGHLRRQGDRRARRRHPRQRQRQRHALQLLGRRHVGVHRRRADGHLLPAGALHRRAERDARLRPLALLPERPGLAAGHVRLHREGHGRARRRRAACR